LSISDNTGSIYRNQDFYKASGSATAIGGFLGVSYLLAKMYTKLSFQIDLKKYKGKIDYEENTLEDADISYMSINYKLSVFFESFMFPFTILLEYGIKDINQLTQALKQGDHNEIKDTFLKVTLNLNFAFLKIPILERFLLYSTYEMGNYSDTNSITISYNQLSYKLLEFVNKGIEVLVGGIFSYENAKFTEYASVDITNLPYYAPSSFITYGGFLQWSQERKYYYCNLDFVVEKHESHL